MWLKTSALVIGLATLSPSINAQTNDYFAIDDIFQLEYANDVSISPDGRYIAYIRNRFNDMKDNTKMVPFKSWWSILRPLFYLRLGIKK